MINTVSVPLLSSPYCPSVVVCALIFLALGLALPQGCCQSDDSLSTPITHQPTDERDAEALRTAQRVLSFPYPAKYLLSQQTSFHPDSGPEYSRALDLMEELGPMAREGTLEYLFDVYEANFDKEFLFKHGFMPSMRSYRAELVLEHVQDKSLFAAVLRKRLSKANSDPVLYEAYLGMAMRLPNTVALEILGEALDDRREAWPHEVWPKHTTVPIQINKNRVCDFAYKKMVEILLPPPLVVDVSSTEQIDSQEEELYERNLTAFKAWWTENKTKVLAGEDVPLPDIGLKTP